MNEDKKRNFLLGVAILAGVFIALLPMVFAFKSTITQGLNTQESNEASTRSETSVEKTEEVSNLAYPVPCVLADSEKESAPQKSAPKAQTSQESMADRVTLPCLTDGGVQGPDYTLAAAAEGKPSVVNMWAWWCQPCRAEIPYFSQLKKEHPEWFVVGVHADQSTTAGIGVLNELGFNLGAQLPQFSSFSDTSGVFGSTVGLTKVIPQTVIFNAQGDVVAVFVQPFSSYQELESAVQGAL